MEKTKAMVGDAVQSDGWKWAEQLEENDGSFPGCQFQVHLPQHPEIRVAVNVVVTGKPKLVSSKWRSRIQIEFVGDGEPSDFGGGWLYHSHP